MPKKNDENKNKNKKKVQRTKCIHGWKMRRTIIRSHRKEQRENVDAIANQLKLSRKNEWKV